MKTARWRKISRNAKRFGQDENGAISVEFVLWMPVFFLVLMLITDTTLVFSAEARLWSITRDAARQMSIYQIDEDTVAAYVAENAIGLNGDLTVTASDTGPDIWVQVSMPIADVALFGVFSALSDPIITARVTQRTEPF